jgi:hypothetical protein
LNLIAVSGADSSVLTAGVPQGCGGNVGSDNPERHVVVLAVWNPTLCKNGKGWGTGTLDFRLLKSKKDWWLYESCTTVFHSGCNLLDVDVGRRLGFGE